MFPLNYMDLYEININPGGTANYVRLASGITGGVQANNDVVDQTTYLDGDGFGSSDVTGGQKTIAFTGHRETGDPAQDYIESIAGDFGDARKTQLRYRNSVGAGFDADVTIANIEIGGGDANAKKDISFEVHANGKPVKVAQSIAPALTMTVAVGVAVGTTQFTSTPDAGNSLAYFLTAGSKGDIYLNQYIDGYTPYTSGSDIIALEGQVLTGVELDPNGRVVKANEHTLVALDIKS